MKKIGLISIVLLFPLFIFGQSAEACYKKGYDYISGNNGVSIDYVEAYKWFKLSADKGYAPGQCALGSLFFEGLGVAKDYVEAVKWYRKSAEQGYALAQYLLGDMYYNGFGMAQDHSKAVEWYKKSARQGFPDAQFLLGYMYEIGEGVTQDYSEAAIWYRKAAEQGNAGAQCQLGFLYDDGKGVDKNYSEAMKWIRKAAEQGNAVAQFLLGVKYHEGKGTPKDMTEAVKWYEKAAEQEYVPAQLYLGIIYYECEKYSEAVKWYRKAAEQGLADAQCRLGTMYEHGYGIQPDNREAMNWYQKAAEQGLDAAQYFLGYLYCSGDEGVRDYNEAVKWLRKAAEQEYPQAQNLLGNLYEMGAGVTQNYQTAREWYQRAVNNNPDYINAKNNLANVEQIIADQPSTNNNVDPTMTKIDMVDNGIPAIGRLNGNTFAVIIANEDYQSETKVDYALNDGEVFRNYCHKTLGLPEKNVHLVTNATLNNIIGELDWLSQVCNAYKGEASVIFYYAGHGIPDEVSGSAYLLPTDGNSRLLRTCFSINELYEDLGKLPAMKVIVLMDACFSGAMRNGGMLASARGVAIKVKSNIPKGNMVVMSAAQGDETAYFHHEAKHGLFTYYLLRKLKETKGSVTLGELSSYIQNEVRKFSIVENGKSQTPTVQASDKLAGSWKSLHF